MNQQVSIAPENALLGAQGLVGQGMVLEMPHAPMAIVVGLQNIEHTSDARVPPPGPKREGRQGSKRCGHGGFGSGGGLVLAYHCISSVLGRRAGACLSRALGLPVRLCTSY